MVFQSKRINKIKRPTHHSDDLKVFEVRTLCGQNLFGNEISFVGGISLKEKKIMSAGQNSYEETYLISTPLNRDYEAGGGRVACKQCTFLLPSSSSSSLALLPTSLRMGLCRGDGAWPGRLRVDIWKEGDRQRGSFEVKGES